MRYFLFDTPTSADIDDATHLLIDPTLDAVNLALADKAAAINRNARARTATLEVEPDRWEKSQYRAAAGGQGVAKAYAKKAWTSPETSVLGVAWAPGGDGRRYVLVYGARVRVFPGLERVHPWGLQTFYDRTGANIVYLQLERAVRLAARDFRTGGLEYLLPGLGLALTGPIARVLLRLVEALPETAYPEAEPGQLSRIAFALRVYSRVADVYPEFGQLGPRRYPARSR